jgi:hypothetical protein
MIKSFCTYACQSLQVATMTQVAGQLRDNQRDSAGNTVATGLCMGLSLGLLTTLVLAVSAH